MMVELFFTATKDSYQVIIKTETTKMTYWKVNLKGMLLYDVVIQYEGIVLGFYFDKQKFSCSDMTYNWVKQSISYEFFLLKTNVIHYNLDVMRIKKNMFDNIFNMIMNMKGKTKIIWKLKWI